MVYASVLLVPISAKKKKKKNCVLDKIEHNENYQENETSS